jgi:hypothetical protein
VIAADSKLKSLAGRFEADRDALRQVITDDREGVRNCRREPAKVF